MNSIMKARKKKKKRKEKKLSTSQCQVIIKLVEEKERDKWFIKNGVLSPYQMLTIKLLQR